MTKDELKKEAEGIETVSFTITRIKE